MWESIYIDDSVMAMGLTRTKGGREVTEKRKEEGEDEGGVQIGLRQGECEGRGSQTHEGKRAAFFLGDVCGCQGDNWRRSSSPCVSLTVVLLPVPPQLFLLTTFLPLAITPTSVLVQSLPSPCLHFSSAA